MGAAWTKAATDILVNSNANANANANANNNVGIQRGGVFVNSNANANGNANNNVGLQQGAIKIHNSFSFGGLTICLIFVVYLLLNSPIIMPMNPSMFLEFFRSIMLPLSIGLLILLRHLTYEVQSVSSNPPEAQSVSSNPPGTVLSWYGPVSRIPEGYALLDGHSITKEQSPYLFETLLKRDIEHNAVLPDARGRTIVGTGIGRNLSTRTLGEVGGKENVRIGLNHMPPHSHECIQHFLWHRSFAGENGNEKTAYNQKSTRTGEEGGGEPLPNMMPFLCLHWIIKL